jgi:hypothetical protein
LLPLHDNMKIFPGIIRGGLFTKVSCIFSGVAPPRDISAKERGWQRSVQLASGCGHHVRCCPLPPPPPPPCNGTHPPFQHCTTNSHHWRWSNPSVNMEPQQPQSLAHSRRSPPMPPTSPHRPTPLPLPRKDPPSSPAKKPSAVGTSVSAWQEVAP